MIPRQPSYPQNFPSHFMGDHKANAVHIRYGAVPAGPPGNTEVETVVCEIPPLIPRPRASQMCDTELTVADVQERIGKRWNTEQAKPADDAVLQPKMSRKEMMWWAIAAGVLIAGIARPELVQAASSAASTLFTEGPSHKMMQIDTGVSPSIPIAVQRRLGAIVGVKSPEGTFTGIRMGADRVLYPYDAAPLDAYGDRCGVINIVGSNADGKEVQTATAKSALDSVHRLALGLYPSDVSLSGETFANGGNDHIQTHETVYVISYRKNTDGTLHPVVAPATVVGGLHHSDRYGLVGNGFTIDGQTGAVTAEEQPPMEADGYMGAAVVDREGGLVGAVLHDSGKYATDVAAGWDMTINAPYNAVHFIEVQPTAPLFREMGPQQRIEFSEPQPIVAACQ